MQFCSLSVFALRDEIAGICASVLKKEFGTESTVIFDLPKESGRGDLTSSVALQIAKKVGKKPQEIAHALAEAVRQISGVTACEVIGGYVNVTLTSSALLQGVSETQGACTPQSQHDGAPVIVDYSSPNIAKPMGIHHILSTVVGQTIANLLTHTGQKVVKWNYIGDWGTQFGKLAVAYEKWGEKKPAREYTLEELLALYVKFHDEAEKNPSLEEEGQTAFRKLEQGDTALRAFWQDVVTVTKDSIASLYRRLSVSFDTDRGESYYEDKMAEIVEEGKKKGVFVSGDKGALIVEFSEESKLPPTVVVKADGATLYMTRDLALMKDRIQSYHPRAILWAVDVAQELYFRQLFATVEKLGWELPDLEHVSFGRMRFADKSMSTRKGNILKLEEVLDEAVKRADILIDEKASEITGDERSALAEMMGVGSVVYGILSQSRKMDIVFDWKKVLTFEGNSAPYLQYTHARAMSVLRKAEHTPKDLPPTEAELTDAERVLVHQLLRFSTVLRDACDERMPHKLATYLYELCQSFNAFYNADPILKADGTVRETRLYLTAVTAAVLRCGAGLLTLSVPDRM